MHDVIKAVQKEIKKVDKPANRINYQRWFKERLKNPIGLKTPVRRKVYTKVFNKIDHSYTKDEILGICDEMVESGIQYMGSCAFDWAKKLHRQLDKSDFIRFEKWLKTYVDNWGACDTLCGVIGLLLVKYPDLSTKRMKWASSKNMWLRRASAVSLIEPVRKGLLFDDVFETAEKLLMDEEDLVQKGYGWMLKVTGDYLFDDAQRFVMKHRNRMPRTALRYAIEKWPETERKKAMGKD